MTINTSDATWIEVQQWAQDAIEAYRSNLEEMQPEMTTYLNRGRIDALRALLRLPAGNVKPAIPETPTY